MLRVLTEFYAQNPEKCTTAMIEDHKKRLGDARIILFGLRASLFEVEELRNRTFESLWYFAYLCIPVILLAPIARWKAMIGVALKDIDIAQACVHATVMPTRAG